MKNYIILLCLMLGLVKSSQASHIMGGEIYYRCVLQNSYEISLVLYRSCAGIPMNPNEFVNIASASCGYNITISLDSVGIPEEVSQVCPSTFTDCSGGGVQGVQRYLYSGIFTFPATCTDWTISYSNCCRNYAIGTGSAGQGMYLEATLNNLAASCNNSPYFFKTGVPYFCVGTPATYNHITLEVDGDSLVYELIDPLQGVTLPVTFFAPYNATYPLATTPANNFLFSPQTGQMDFTPAIVQNGVLAVRVKEYRNGVMIGSVIRDMQIITMGCGTGSNSVGITPPLNVSGGMQPGLPNNPYYFEACPGDTLSFQVVVSTDTSTTLSVQAGYSGVNIPGAITSINYNPTANLATVSFYWVIPVGASGNYGLYVSAANDFCAIFGIASAAYQIHVTGIEWLVPDVFVCPDALPDTLHLVTYGGNPAGTYSWIGSNVFSPTAAESDVIINALPAYYTIIYEENACVITRNLTINPAGSVDIVQDTAYYCNDTIQLQTNASYQVPLPTCDTISSIPCPTPPIPYIVGTGTVPSDTSIWWNEFTPFLGYDEDFKTAYLYRAADLLAAGMSSGLIHSMAFEVIDKNSFNPYQNLNVGIRCTDRDSFETNSPFPAGMINVFSGVYTTTPGWNVIPFSSPFYWDGVSNLYIQFCDDEAYGVTMGGNDDVSGTLMPYRCNNTESTYYNQGCALNTGFKNYFLPNIQFEHCNITPTITYSWSPTNGLSDSTIANPTVSGINQDILYYLTASYQGCEVTDSVWVIKLVPELNIPSPQYVCAGSPHTLTATGNILLTDTITWLNLSTGAILQGNTITVNISDTTIFRVSVQNACGVDTQLVTVNWIPAIVPQIQTTSASCSTGNVGTIALTISGGAGSYIYTWSTNPPTYSGNLSNLAAGQYTVNIVDALGCTASAMAQVGLDTTWTASIVNVQDVSYNGGNDGSATVQVSNTTGTFTYTWNTTPAQYTATANNLVAGTYQVIVDNLTTIGCSQTLSVTIIEPPVIVASSKLVNPASCFGKNDGVAEVIVSGGTGNYAYSWLTTPPQFTKVATNLAAGTYTAYVKDVLEPTFNKNVSIAVTEPNKLEVLIDNVQDVACYGEATGSITAMSVGGNGGYQYLWNSVPPQNSATATQLSQQVYTVIVKDSLNCFDTKMATVNAPLPLQVIVDKITDGYCEFANGQVEVSATGGNEGYTYTWNSVPPQYTSTLSNAIAGNYAVSVVDARGCVTVLNEIALATTPHPIANFTFEPDSNVLTLSRAFLEFNNTSQYGNRYFWSFGDGKTSTSFNPNHLYNSIAEVQILLIAYDENEYCPDSMVKMLRIIPNGDIFIASSFTPNGDNVNDVFSIPSNQVLTCEMKIFNRWGKMVKGFSSTSDIWDGKDLSGQNLPEGVYTYQLKATNLGGQYIEKAGTITLIR